MKVKDQDGEENKDDRGQEESKEKQEDAEDEEEEDRMLVFKDMHGQLWQISKVEEDIENFDELL